MLSTVSLALALTATMSGPPKLPPLPGERPPPSADPATPTPTSPTPSPANKSGPTPAPPPPRTAAPLEPSTPQPTKPPPPSVGPSVPADAIAQPNLPVEPSPGRPAVVEPPQPAATGPAPETEEDGQPRRRNPRGGGGPGAAPPMGADLLPGDEQPERPAFVLPPPRRPPFTGIGLFIGAGITFSAALTEQIIAHVLVKRQCIDPFAKADNVDPADEMPDETRARNYSDALIECAPGVLPAVALRVHSDIGLLATIGLASAGAALRGQRAAYDDVFANRGPNAMLGLRAAGAGLVGAGVVTWFTTGAISWGLLAKCRSARCATRARLMSFTTRDTGAVLIAAGAGMLAYTISHRRGYDRILRERAMSVGLSWLPSGGGLSLRGRF